jgi:hypothetical protein
MSGREAMCRFVFWRIASYSPELPNTYFARDAMNDTIKIWKSNLQASWRKLSTRSIFFGASATSNEQIPMTTFYVSVAAFNNEGQVCELRIPQPFGPALLAGGRVRGESAVLDEVKKRFTDLNARSVIDRLAGSRWPDRANQTVSQRLLDCETGVTVFRSSRSARACIMFGSHLMLPPEVG